MNELIPYGRQDISEDDISAVVNILRGDFLTQGPAVERFESALAAYLNSGHVVAASNGTAGLHIAYLAAGIGKGDAVIVPAITFAATSNAALYCGATPVFADIDPETGGVCPKSVQRCVALANAAGLKVKAIAPVHFAGKPCELLPLSEIARNYNLLIIEDACHALGAEYRLTEKEVAFDKVGSSKLASMTVFSFHPVKHVTTGEGGAVTTQDPDLAKRLRLFRSHGMTKSANDFKNIQRATFGPLQNPWYMEMHELGLNYRLCDIQAALGESQVKRLPMFINRRREIAAQYNQAFAGKRNISPAARDSANTRHSYHLYPLRVNFASLDQSRASFMSALRKKGVGSQVHYIPVLWHPFYESHSNLWMSDTIEGAVKFYDEELSIPMYPGMSDQEVQNVIEVILRETKN
ncbi:MAG: UDP-4-amino-4,6-dideoxy-N-acetyl-beta-L-altrosamine transaminase [Proteobacteria bacterium]|nr:UDP-4-amino-4,6-dideoxy-N-acetyl-beta-L-altrosamine transaminase [Pseudomonadota bacterium]